MRPAGSNMKKVYGAPLITIVCSDRNTTWTRPFDGKKLTDINASIITDHMMMKATNLGLGSVWICYFKPDVLKKEFAIPEGLEPVIWRRRYSFFAGSLGRCHNDYKHPQQQCWTAHGIFWDDMLHRGNATTDHEDSTRGGVKLVQICHPIGNYPGYGHYWDSMSHTALA